MIVNLAVHDCRGADCHFISGIVSVLATPDFSSFGGDVERVLGRSS
jgi:hypothetical protein